MLFLLDVENGGFTDGADALEVIALTAVLLGIVMHFFRPSSVPKLLQDVWLACEKVLLLAGIYI